MKSSPYLVAEISANHCGSIKLAKQLIKSAKKNGADAVKLQTYTPETMTLIQVIKNFLLKKVSGKVISYGICIKKLIHR